MERGYRPEEIFAMPRMEQGIMQAIAELNREQCKDCLLYTSDAADD